MSEKLIFPIGFDLEEGVAQVEKDWGKMQKKLQDTFKSQTIQVDADISKAVLDKLYAKFEGLIKTMESKAPQIKLKIPDTVDFEQEINRLKVQLKSINLGELTDAESKDLYLYIRQLEALAKALKEVNKQEQLRQANRPEVIALKQAQAEEKRTRSLANSALAEQRRAKIATESARQAEINNRSAQRSAVIAEQQRAATARAENAELRLTRAKERSTQATHEQNSAYNSQSTYLSRLHTRMAAYFSIHQAMSFLRNIREVTAEFELQRVALGALIQDMYKADTIFEQIKEAAVRSPFEVKDLVKFTKQLAAYGVESEDLFDTIDGLADISAGLGAEMDRLVLAFGQIKAAGVLKGTELRQLTETGLPMVELLADYYSTLRGEVVSTSQVFDMISNKEIPFEAVQDILEDLTSEGGRFFEMQEKQADTLHGRWTNLKDALSIMFDEMGRSEEVQALMNDFIDGTKWLAENWRLIWQQVKILIFTFGGLKASQAILNGIFVSTARAEQATRRYAAASAQLTRAQAKYRGAIVLNARYTRIVTLLQMKAVTSTNILTRALARLGAVILANPVGAIMTLASVLSFFIIKNKAAEASIESLEDKQRAYAKEAVENVEVQIALFKRLANEVVNYADGSERQNAALRKLKDRFGDMIPEYQLTAKHLREVSEEANGSATAFDNMANSLQNVMHERIRTKLIEDRYKEVEDKFLEVYDKASGGGFQFVEDLAKMQKRVLDGEYWETVFLEWRKTMEGASAVLEYSGYWEHRLSDRGEKFLKGFVVPKTPGFYHGEKITYTWKQILDALNAGKITPEDYDLLLGGIIGAEAVQNIESLKEYLRLLGTVEPDVNKIMNDFEDFSGEFSEVNDVIIKARQDLKGLDEVGGSNAEEVAENYAKEMSKIEKEVVKGLFDTLDDATKQQISSELLDDVEKGEVSIDWLSRHLRDGKLDEVELPDDFLYGLKEAKTLFGEFDTDWKRFIADQQDFVDNRKVVAFDETQIKNFTSLHEAVKTTSEEYDNLSKRLKELKTIQSSWKDKGWWWRLQNPDAVEATEEEIEKIEARMKLLEKIMDRYGRLGKEEDKRDPVKERLSLLKDEISTVEKIYNEYQSLRKYMGEAEAQASIEEMFGNVPFEILDMATNVDEMRAQLEKAKDEAKRLGDDKLVLDIEYKLGKLDIDESKRKFEQNMRKLSDELSRTKTAKEFFDRMLGLTGDKQLSASLTVSIYGGVSSDDLGETLAKDMAEKLEKQVQEYFGDIDISSAINKTTGEIDPIKLEELLTDENIKAIGEDNVKEIRKIIDDLVSANAKYWDDLMKDLEKARTYGDKLVKVYETTQERIAKINAREDLDEDAKKQLIDQINELQGKEMQKLQYEAFKDSPMYVAMFENLDTTSTTMLKNMRSHLVKLKSEWKNLDPTQLKELQSRINEIDKQLSVRSPFKSIIDGIKEFDALQKSGSRKDAEEALAYAAERRLHAERRYQQAVADGKSDEEIKQLASLLEKCKEAEDEAAKKMSEWDDATQKVVQGFNDLQQVVNLVQTTTSAVNDIVNAFGGWGDVADEEFWNTMIEGINGLMSGAQSAGTGIAQIMSGDIIGGATSLISGIGSIVSSITNLAYAGTIKRANQEIERQQELLDSLSYSYGRLQQEAEKAFGTEYIQNYNRQLANLEAQVEAYEKQLDAERSKGKTSDEEKIKEYQEQIRDTKDAIEDMYGSLSEHFLGTDLTSAARDFASAWIDAYKEFANTTDAMKAKFQEMIQNMIVESLIAKVMERALKPVFDMVDNMGDSDFYSNSFWSQLMTEMNKATENGVVGAQNIMGILESIGINLRDTGTGLTGISRDIASASEESILGLAAGINTQNFYISQVPTKLDTIIGLLRGGSAVVDSGVNVQDLITIQNQFLSHLPTIAQNTAETVARCERAAVACESMASKLGSVIKPKGTTSTHSVNVTIGS